MTCVGNSSHRLHSLGFVEDLQTSARVKYLLKAFLVFHDVVYVGIAFSSNSNVLYGLCIPAQHTLGNNSFKESGGGLAFYVEIHSKIKV